MSAILSADDLNDFISPGVACIKPVETLPPSADALAQTTNHHHNSDEVILDGDAAAASTPATGAPAEISLTDCLACSGCVTSAEAVLVSLQSHAELLSVLDGAPGLRLSSDSHSEPPQALGLENPDSKLFVASVSPQARASLAAAAGVSSREAGRMLDNLLSGAEGLPAGGKYQNGFTWVVDTNAAREACLILGAEEAIESSTTAIPSGGDRAAKPVLASSCPGWVCYAEKTHPHVLPHISRIKSPQALTGTLLKTTLSKTLGISPDRIWHLAVMPCFDKKLEASREELTDSVWNPEAAHPTRGVRDVDCVITSKEVLMLAEARGLGFFRLPKTPIPSVPFPESALERFLFPPRRTGQSDPLAGTSGGNLYYVLQYVAARHAGATIETVRGRNADVVEYTVASATGNPIFKAARYYGFRNIQNLVRRLKPAKPSRMPGAKGVGRRPAGKQGGGLEYAYVEVMACPGGCTNGGGQIKVDDPVVVERKGLGDAKPGPAEQKQWLAEVDEAYFSADDDEALDAGVDEMKARDDTVAGISPSYIRDTLAHWTRLTGVDRAKLVQTTYREVVSDVGKTGVSDTERVVQLAGKIGGGW
ncbi:cytosolic Fe-S cluster assembly factor nar-1 [Xylariomycetidae sp. FL0641]|nr:cytosolic Fe-S cluster assembly factor nar-1 [Xylariomycetidae sp. FL0641]